MINRIKEFFGPKRKPARAPVKDKVEAAISVRTGRAVLLRGNEVVIILSTDAVKSMAEAITEREIAKSRIKLRATPTTSQT